MNSDELYTKRLDAPRQDLSDAYSLPANFLEIELVNPVTHGVGWRQRYTDYEVKVKARQWIGKLMSKLVKNTCVTSHQITSSSPSDYLTNLPVFKLKESSVRRRYSDFEWLVTQLERESKIVVPALPGKALKKQLPFRNDDGLFTESFIEERRKGLEIFINKVSGHPLAQNERCLHMFLQEQDLDKNYVPGKIRTV